VLWYIVGWITVFLWPDPLGAPILRVGDWEVSLSTKESPTEIGSSKEARTTWPLLAGLVLIVLLAAVSCGGAAGEQRAKESDEDEQASVERPQAETGEPQAGVALEHPSLGDEDAPVVITEYADYQ
jgi:hypothetical protein